MIYLKWQKQTIPMKYLEVHGLKDSFVQSNLFKSIKIISKVLYLLNKFKAFRTSIEKNNETYKIQIVLTVLIFPMSSIPAIKPWFPLFLIKKIPAIGVPKAQANPTADPIIMICIFNTESVLIRWKYGIFARLKLANPPKCKQGPTFPTGKPLINFINFGENSMGTWNPRLLLWSKSRTSWSGSWISNIRPFWLHLKCIWFLLHQLLAPLVPEYGKSELKLSLK